MPPPNHLDKPSARALEEASAWVTRAKETPYAQWSLGDRAELAHWLEQSADNRIAHDAVELAWEEVGDLGATSEMLALRRAALNATARPRRERLGRPLWSGALSPWVATAAALVILVGVSALLTLSRASSPEIYQTAVGERRVVTLSDGSKISLDEGTRVSVAYTGRFRDLRLERGQAEFEVASDPLRPFSVTATDRRVVATGTLFNVDLLQGRLIVTLVHGEVLVAREAAGATDAPIALRPAERLVVERSTGRVTKSVVDPSDVEAWKLGKLVFQATPLAEAVERVNRYAHRDILLAAPEQGQQPISGVFDAADSYAFADAVSAHLPLRSEVGKNAIVLKRK